MFLTKLIAYYSVLIILSQASKDCTRKTPGFCKGGINIGFQYDELGELIDRKEDFEKIKLQHPLFEYVVHSKEKIPPSFDARFKWPVCRSIFQIKDQGTCGTSWAFATAMVTTDRSCISSGGKKLFNVSEQDLITCCYDCYPNPFKDPRCTTASNLVSPLMYMIDYGVASGKCKKYDINKVQSNPKGCKRSCDNKKTSYKRIKILRISFGLIRALISSVREMQIEIMKNGPVASFLKEVPSDFQLQYTNKVYIHTNKKQRKGPPHAIRVLGWGTEYNVPYWICANSWGTKWGKLGGFFKIRRGTNELGIEEFFIAAKLDLGKLKVRDRDVFNPTGDFAYGDAGYTESNGTSNTRKLQLYKIIVIVLITFIL